MSVFKRLGNVAKGKVLEWSNDSEAPSSVDMEAELEQTRRRQHEDSVKPPPRRDIEDAFDGETPEPRKDRPTREKPMKRTL